MKNTFLEAVSHDLRTPLTSILGSALTLEQSRLALPHEDTVDLVRRIAANARKLDDSSETSWISIGCSAASCRRSGARPIYRRSCIVRWTRPRTPLGRPIEVEVEAITASVDAAKVERIVENLVSNALRHTPTTAHVWVRAEGRDGGVLLTVEDDGPGIPDALREEVFEPFRQAPGSAAGHSPGVGIGLSLVRRFAELHGGRAWVEDRPGGGSSFAVFLPGG